MDEKVRLKKKGKKTITFTRGGLHATTGTPEGKTIPAEKMQKALAGDYGEKGRKQAVMAKGLLAKGRKTAVANKRKKKNKAA